MPEEKSGRPKSILPAVTAIVSIVIVVAAILLFKENSPAQASPKQASSPANTMEAQTAARPPVTASAKMPRLLDLGAGKCIPCKAMAPILEDLKKTFERRLSVEFIDVWKNQDEATKYKISMIPTQIFFDADGKELFRHEGFFSKEEILAKWKDLGFEFPAK